MQSYRAAHREMQKIKRQQIQMQRRLSFKLKNIIIGINISY